MADKYPKLYEMGLGEIIVCGPYEVMRVPGGWIYLCIRGCAFVPFHNEFQKPESPPEKGKE